MLVLCKKENCAQNESGVCSVRGEIQLDEMGKCLSMVEMPEEKIEPEVIKKPLDGVVICLDAGHEKKANRSPSIPEYYESEMAWQLLLLLKKELNNLGALVTMTRISINEVKSLMDRGMFSRGADLFLSLHSNAVGNGMNETIDYVAVYHLTNDTTTDVDDISAEVAKYLAPVIARTMNVKQGYKILTRKSSNDRNKDGIMNDNYYGVLNGARIAGTPGLILEHSFHTNTNSVRWLLEKSNLERLAKEEADAIAEYFVNRGGKKNPDYVCRIRVANVPEGDVLYVRKDPTHKSEVMGSLKWNDKNIYTIVEEENGWGKLKSGLGWINLGYTEII